MVEIRLERLQVSDIGLTAISKCPTLEILHLVKALDCTNIGVVAVAEHCKLLRKLHIDGWRSNRIGDEGLIAIAKNSVNLQEFVLIGLNPSVVVCLQLTQIARSWKDWPFVEVKQLGMPRFPTQQRNVRARRRSLTVSLDVEEVEVEAVEVSAIDFGEQEEVAEFPPG